MNQSIYSRKTKAFGMPTKWLFFYIFIRFPLSFLSFIITLVNSYIPYFPYLFGGYLAPVFYIALLMDFACFAISVITFVKLLKLSPSSFKWNMVYLWFSVGCEVLGILISGSFSPYMLGRITGAFCWAAANLSYFNKRSELFEMEIPPQTPAYVPNYDYVQQPGAPMQNAQSISGGAPSGFSASAGYQPYQNASPSPEAPANAAACFCPKCGNALIAGAKFCNRCGAQMEENNHEL